MSDTTPSSRALLMERRRALYAQLKGAETIRQGVLMEISAIDKELGATDGSTDKRPGPRPERRRQG